MAGVEGFEPSQAVLETDVLPLTLYPYKFKTIYKSKQQNEKHFHKLFKDKNKHDQYTPFYLFTDGCRTAVRPPMTGDCKYVR